MIQLFIRTNPGCREEKRQADATEGFRRRERARVGVWCLTLVSGGVQRRTERRVEHVER
jgi:hypothetical protein